MQRRFAEKKAGRTGLTRDEERQLWAEARAEASAPVMYWDSVFSVDKTVSLAHATALAEAAVARRAGAGQDAAAWQARADAIEEEFSAAVRTAIGWMQHELAFVRRGSHAHRVEGVESGRFEDAQQPLAEGGDGGFDGGEEVARVDRAGEPVTLDLGPDRVLEFGEHQAGALVVQRLVEFLQHVGCGGVHVGHRPQRGIRAEHQNP